MAETKVEPKVTLEIKITRADGTVEYVDPSTITIRQPEPEQED